MVIKTFGLCYASSRHVVRRRDFNYEDQAFNRDRYTGIRLMRELQHDQVPPGGSSCDPFTFSVPKEAT